MQLLVEKEINLKHFNMNLPNEQRNERPWTFWVLFECEEQLERGHRVSVTFYCTDFSALLFAFEI